MVFFFLASRMGRFLIGSNGGGTPLVLFLQVSIDGYDGVLRV